MWTGLQLAVLGMGIASQPMTAELSWLEGRWLHCDAAGVEAVEIWSGTGGNLLGSMAASVPGWGRSFSQMRLMASRGVSTPYGRSYFIRLEIEPQTELEFGLVEARPGHAVFENEVYRDSDLDIPYRISYSLSEGALTVQADYSRQDESEALLFRPAAFGTNCEGWGS